MVMRKWYLRIIDTKQSGIGRTHFYHFYVDYYYYYYRLTELLYF